MLRTKFQVKWPFSSGEVKNRFSRWRPQTQRKIMLLSHTLTMRGSDVASFGWIPPSGLGDSMTDRWMNTGMDAQKNVTLAHPYHEGKWCSKFGWLIDWLCWGLTTRQPLFVCVEVLRPSQPMGSCRARSVYLTTRLLGRLSPLRG